MRVLVTRAAEDGERTAAALADLGHSALLAPVLEIRLASGPLPAGRFDATLATSAHAFAGPPGGIEHLRPKPLYVVGDATARAARQAGFKDVRTSRGDGRDLASLVALTLPRAAGLLYLAGRDRKPATEESLASAGYKVTAWLVYAAEPVETWSLETRQELAAGHVEAALHYSNRSAALALETAERSGVRKPVVALDHLCLSDDIASVLTAASAPRIRVAARPEEASLLALLRPES